MADVTRLFSLQLPFSFQLLFLFGQHDHNLLVMNGTGSYAVEQFPTVTAKHCRERRVNVLVMIGEGDIIPEQSRADDTSKPKTLEVKLGSVVDEVMHSTELFLLHACIA